LTFPITKDTTSASPTSNAITARSPTEIPGAPYMIIMFDIIAEKKKQFLYYKILYTEGEIIGKWQY
jgi:hypothetical protein